MESYDVFTDGVGGQEWEAYAREFADYSIYQTWPYQQVRSETERQDISRAAVQDSQGKIRTLCQVRIKKVPLLGMRIGYVQSGPLMLDRYRNVVCTSECIDALRDAYLREKVNVLRIVPNVRNDECGLQVVNILESCGFRKARGVMPYRTLLVSLVGAEDEILGRIHRDCRRILRKAEKQIEIAESTSDESFEILEELYEGAKMRKGFGGIDASVFRRAQQMLPCEHKLQILVARYNGRPVTAHATAHLGDTAVPVITASNNDGLKHGAAYLVWWKAYLCARKRGMEYYDLGGIDEKTNPKGHLFKRRMGGTEVYHIGAFDACNAIAARMAWRMLSAAYKYCKK